MANTIRWDPVPRVTTQYVDWFLETWNRYRSATSNELNWFTFSSPPGNTLIPFGQIVILPRRRRKTDQGSVANRGEFCKLVYLDPAQYTMELSLKNVFRLLKQSDYKNMDSKMLDAVGA
jgi:hypothetical protein